MDDGPPDTKISATPAATARISPVHRMDVTWEARLGPRYRFVEPRMLRKALLYWKTERPMWWRILRNLDNQQQQDDGFMTLRPLMDVGINMTPEGVEWREFFTMVLSLGLYPVETETGGWTLVRPTRAALRFLADGIDLAERLGGESASRPQVLSMAKCTECQAHVMGRILERPLPPPPAAEVVIDTTVNILEQKHDEEKRVLQTSIDDMQQEFSQQSESLRRAKEQLEALRTELTDVSTKLQECKQALESPPAQLQESMRQVDQVSKKAAQVEEHLDALEKDQADVRDTAAKAIPSSERAGDESLATSLRSMLRQKKTELQKITPAGQTLPKAAEMPPLARMLAKAIEARRPAFAFSPRPSSTIRSVVTARKYINDDQHISSATARRRRRVYLDDDQSRPV